MSELTLIVREAIAETPLVKAIVLDSADGAPLPAFEAGAHVRVKLPEGGDRPYSLVDHPDHRGSATWVLGVRLEDPSAGGSRHMHGLAPGDRVSVSPPRNDFPLHDDARPALLIAGGIGITPILSMAAALARAGRDFRLHYAGRARGQLAFLEPLQAICGERLACHYDDDPQTRLNVVSILSDAPPDAVVYVCGPQGMIEAVKAAAAGLGIPPDRVRSELFTKAPAAGADDAPFEVELKSSGQVVTVAPGQSIIDALEAAGVDVLYDCRRGDCGICQCDVIEGVPDHRDVILSDAEKASGKVMQICVSRAKSSRLVLDL